MREIVIEEKESLIDENEDVKYRTKDLPCENTLKGKSFFVNKVFLIIALRAQKSHFLQAPPICRKLSAFRERGECVRFL